MLERLTQSRSQRLVYYQEACRYWVKACLGVPYFRRNGENIDPPHGRTICFEGRASSALATCLMNSSLFYWYYSVFSDCEHINDALIRGFPLPGSWGDEDWLDASDHLMADLVRNSRRKAISIKQGHIIEYD